MATAATSAPDLGRLPGTPQAVVPPVGGLERAPSFPANNTALVSLFALYDQEKRTRSSVQPPRSLPPWMAAFGLDITNSTAADDFWGSSPSSVPSEDWLYTPAGYDRPTLERLLSCNTSGTLPNNNSWCTVPSASSLPSLGGAPSSASGPSATTVNAGQQH